MSNRNLSESLAADHTVLARTVTPKSISTTNSGRKDLDFIASNKEDFSTDEEVEKEEPTSSEEVPGEESTNKRRPKSNNSKKSILYTVRVETIALIVIGFVLLFGIYKAYKGGMFKL